MKKAFMMLCVVTIAAAFANTGIIQDDEHGYVPENNLVVDGQDYRTGYPEDCTNYLPDDMNLIPAPKPDCYKGDPGPGAPYLETELLEDPNIDWGADILVDAAPLSAQAISADRGGDTGDIIYVGVCVDGASADTLRVWKSTDQGQTWTMIRHAYGTGQTYSHLTLRYATGAEEWIMCTWIITDASNNGDVWGRRISTDGSSTTFVHPTTVGAADTITWVSASRSFETNYSWSVFWQDEQGGTGTMIKRIRSTDYGDTWIESGNNQGGRQYPHIDYGAGGYLYVVANDIAAGDIRVGRSTTYGAGGWSFDWLTSDGAAGLCRIAATKDAGPTGWAWGVYNHDNGTDWDAAYGYSTDGGGSWNTGETLAGGAGDQGGADVDVAGYGSNFTRSVVLDNDNPDGYWIEYRSNAASTPTGWGSPTAISDWYVYSGMMPKITAYGVGTGNSGLAAFPGRPGAQDCLVDTWHNTGVEESSENIVAVKSFTIFPNPATRTVNFSYNLQAQGTVEFSVYNVNGQLISHLDNNAGNIGHHTVTWNAENLPAGVYFVGLTANGHETPVQKMVLLK